MAHNNNALVAGNDSTGDYMATREAAILTPAQRRRISQQAVKKPEEESSVSLSGAFDVFTGVSADLAGGIIEAPRQIVGGVLDATKELAQFMETVIPLGRIGGGELTEDSFFTADEPRTKTGGFVRGVSQFLTGFLPAIKGLKAVGVSGKLTQAFIAGGGADAFVFDPHEARLSNLIQEFDELKNPVTKFLAAEPGDTAAEGRFKNAIEGMGLGLAAEGLFRGVKAVRAHQITKAEERQIIADKKTSTKLIETIKEKITGKGKKEITDEVIPEDVATPEIKVTFADPSAAKNINLNKLNTTEDVKNLIESVAEAEPLKINKARREIITNEVTEKLADDLGMSVDDLLDRRRGQAFNAEQAVAARKILVASGENLFKLAKTASTGNDKDVVLFRKALAQHSAIQSQVSGLTAEAGRALQSFRIQAKSAKLQEQAIKDALEAGGGTTFSKDIAFKISQLDDANQLNTFVRQAEKATTPQMVYEAWINGLLSSPQTHVVNLLSNSLVAAWSVGERKVASMIGNAMGGQSIPDGEAAAQLKGMIEGSKDGLRLAWKALKTGVPSDPLQKIENQGRRAISAENLELSGVPGRFADFLGETVRIPGRLLTAGDELFKTMGYRMELNAQAYRTGYNEGLRGDDLAKRMADIIANPPDNIHITAVDAGRYQTFTRELGAAGKAVEQVRSKVPGARVILPFIRTPSNIIKFVGERTPLAPLSKAVRAEFAAGGARRDMALAKIATGSALMAASADFALSGDITGAGPTNHQMRNILRETGWQPYSIKINDNYFSYSRLDSVGAFIGLSADIAEISGQTGEFNALDLSTAAIISTSQNVTSKTYLRGVTEFFDVMASASADPEANNKRAQRWITRLAGTVIPSGVAVLERTLSPELEATYGIIDKIKSRLPGFSDDLPPRRNIYGDPIVLQGGLGPDIMSPIYTSTKKDDPVSNEIVKQQTLLRMPMMNINGVELSPTQYDRYILLYSGKDNRFTKEVKLKTKLNEIFRTAQYRNATDGQDGGKSLFIRTIFASYRDAAKAQMFEEFPSLKSDIILSKRQKILELTGR